MANTFKYYPETMGNSSGYPISLPFPKGSATSAVNVARQLPKYLGHVPRNQFILSCHPWLL